MASPSTAEIRAAVRAALAEDIRSGDVTTDAIIPPRATSTARMIAREPLVATGVTFAMTAFAELDPHACFSEAASDGTRVPGGGILLAVTGASRALLTAERVALNFVQRLSGIATLTAAFVAAVAGTRARILDTRKTTPGWRTLEKYAVSCGGGLNHRHALDDLVLIKDNHLAALRDAAPNPIAAAVQRAREFRPYLRVEVEADTLEQVRQTVEAGADIVLLDNMPIEVLRDAVEICRGRILTEASGGVRLDTVRSMAEAGVDFISVGGLTHSARAMDVGLDFAP